MLHLLAHFPAEPSPPYRRGSSPHTTTRQRDVVASSANFYGTTIETPRKLEVESPAALGSRLASPTVAPHFPKRNPQLISAGTRNCDATIWAASDLGALHSDYDPLSLGRRISAGQGQARPFFCASLVDYKHPFDVVAEILVPYGRKLETLAKKRVVWLAAVTLRVFLGHS
jgi:hypothetical protein